MLLPFSGRVRRVSLLPQDILCFAFWSKDYAPFLPQIEDLETRGFQQVFNTTITGLPRLFEPSSPCVEQSVEVTRRLGRLTAPERVLWRYDPIVISSLTPVEYHIRAFSDLASSLAGLVPTCTISFLKPYPRVRASLARITALHGVTFRDPGLEERQELAQALQRIAVRHDIELRGCCEPALLTVGLRQAHCIDGEEISRLTGQAFISSKPTREGCGCAESVDLGAYGTCTLGCMYCYAGNERASDPMRGGEDLKDREESENSPVLGLAASRARALMAELETQEGDRQGRLFALDGAG